MASSRRELTDLQKRLEYLEKEIGKDEVFNYFSWLK